jgi:hypothetical protein
VAMLLKNLKAAAKLFIVETNELLLFVFLCVCAGQFVK